MKDLEKYLIEEGRSVRSALESLSTVGLDTILFVVNKNNQLVGSITDGDIRRKLLEGLKIDDMLKEAMNSSPKYIKEYDYSISEIVKLRKENISVFPLLDKNHVIVDVINLRYQKSALPVDVVIMAGGKGLRLKPLTDNLPKPLLKIKGKCIIDYSFKRLRDFGVRNFSISVNYLGDLLEQHFKDRAESGISVQIIRESEPKGTIGSASQVTEIKNDFVLVTNSDILTNLDYEDFFMDFIRNDADMSVVTIPYETEVPYAVIKTNGNIVKSLEEKPTYTYFSNAGIYLVKKEILKKIPRNQFFDATDLIQVLLDDDLKIINYPFKNYWIDIGWQAWLCFIL